MHTTRQTQQNVPELESGIAVTDGNAMDTSDQSIATACCSDLSLLAERRLRLSLLLEEASFESLQDPFSLLPFPRMTFAATGVRSIASRCDSLQLGYMMDDQDPHHQDDSSTTNDASSFLCDDLIPFVGAPPSRKELEQIRDLASRIK